MATRHEKVILDLEDKFTGPVLRAAAAAKLLDKNLSGVGHSADKASKDVDRMGSKSSGEFSKVEKDAMRASRSSSVLVDSLAMLGPAIVPLAAAAVPAIAGLSAQLGFAAGAAGVAVLAFHGVGDALKAVDTYQLTPTTANFIKMQQELEKLGPAGREFVRELDHMKDLLAPLQDTARAGLFPGITEGMEALTTRIPQVQRIIAEMATASGRLFAQAGESLAGGGWDDFFNFIEREASPQLQALGETLGNLAHTAANLFVAFEPMETSFSQGLVNATQKLQDWSAGLSQTQGFRDFVDYVQKSGPQVAEAVGKIANALIQVVQAAAPMGGPTLKALGAFADIVAAIANSPIGTPLFAMAAGLAAVNRALSIRATARDSLVGNLLTGRGAGASGIQRTTTALGGFSTTARTVGRDMNVMATSFATAGARTERETKRIATSSARLKSNLSGIGKGAAALGGLTLATSGAADGMGLTNTASLALMGTIAGPWGAAIGGGVGLMMDMSHAGDNAARSARDFEAALKGIDPKPLQDKIRDINSSTLTPLKQPARFTGGRGANPGQYGAAAQAAGQLSAAQKRLNEINAEGASRLQRLGAGFAAVAASASTGEESLAEFQGRVERLNAVLSGRAGLRDYQAAIDDLRKSLRDNGRTLDINTEKGRANQAALDNIASSALNVAKNMKRADQRRDFLAGARKALVDAAVAAGRTRKAAGQLADRLLGLGRMKPKPKVDLDKSRADAKGKQVNRMLDAINGKRPKPKADIDITRAAAKRGAMAGIMAGIDRMRANPVVTITVNNMAAVGAAQAAIAGIHSKTVTVTTNTVKKARGGWLDGPGTGTSDSIPLWGSKGEYMVNAKAAAMYPHELEWINAQGLRNGGYAGAAPSVSVAGSNNTFLVDLGDLGGMVEVKARQVSEDVMLDAADMAGARSRAGSGGWS